MTQADDHTESSGERAISTIFKVLLVMVPLGFVVGGALLNQDTVRDVLEQVVMEVAKPITKIRADFA